MVQIVTGLGSALWDKAAGALRAANAAGRQALLLVPEQMTLQAERDALEALNARGFFTVQVLSPSRLASQVFDRARRDERALIDERGQAMTLARVLHNLKDGLAYYGSSQGQPGFTRKLLEAISELKGAGLTPAALSAWLDTQENAHPKLQDLALLYAAYEAGMEGQLADREDRERAMLQRLAASQLFSGQDIIVHGFDLLTPPLVRLLCALSPQARGLLLTLVIDPASDPDGSAFAPVSQSVHHLTKELDKLSLAWAWERLPESGESQPPALRHLRRQLLRLRQEPYQGLPDGLRLYAGKTPHEEVRRVAQLITSQLARGEDPRGIAVYFTQEGYAGLLPGVFSDYGIPHFVAAKEPILAQPLVRCLLDALRCVQAAAWRPADVFSYLKSPYAPLSPEEAWKLENYARAYGIRGRLWTRPFTRGAEQAALLEPLRQKAIGPVDSLREGLVRARSAAQSIGAVLGFLESIGARQTVMDVDVRLRGEGLLEEAQRATQVWDRLMGLFEQMDQLLGAQRVPLGRFAEWLEAGLSMTNLSALPPRQHSVQAGALGQLMTRAPHTVYILGLNNGALSVTEEGLIADQERGLMASGLDAQLNLPQQDRERVRLLDLWKAVAQAGQNAHLSYALSDDQGKAMAPLIELIRLKKTFPRLLEEGGAVGSLNEPGPLTPAVALDELALRLYRRDVDGPWKDAWAALLASPVWQGQARAVLREAAGELPQATLSADTAAVFRQSGVVSVSRLESYAGCPFKHFVDYGLSPAEREEWALEARDFGTFYHAAMDGFTRLMQAEPAWPHLDREAAERAMDQVLDTLSEGWADGPLADSPRAMEQARKAKNLCRRMAWALTEGRANSRFEPLWTEARFGPGEDLPAIEIQLPDGKVLRLRGTMDRVDTAVLDGELKLVRVIDYKSGHNQLEGGDLEAGVQLQLMLYLRTALELLADSQPAGAFYQQLADPIVTARDAQQSQKEGRKALRMNGVLLAEPGVVRAMDFGEPPVSLTGYLKKDGSLVDSPALLSAAELRRLMDLAGQRTRELALDIFRGHIARSPLVRAKGRAECDYCQYQGICRAGKISGEPLRRHSRRISLKELANEPPAP